MKLYCYMLYEEGIPSQEKNAIVGKNVILGLVIAGFDSQAAFRRWKSEELTAIPRNTSPKLGSSGRLRPAARKARKE